MILGGNVELLKSTVMEIYGLLSRKEKQKFKPPPTITLAFVVIMILFLFSAVSTFCVYFLTDPFTNSSSSVASKYERFFVVGGAFTTFVINFIFLFGLCWSWRYVFGCCETCCTKDVVEKIYYPKEDRLLLVKFKEDKDSQYQGYFHQLSNPGSETYVFHEERDDMKNEKKKRVREIYRIVSPGIDPVEVIDKQTSLPWNYYREEI